MEPLSPRNVVNNVGCSQHKLSIFFDSFIEGTVLGVFCQADMLR